MLSRKKRTKSTKTNSKNGRNHHISASSLSISARADTIRTSRSAPGASSGLRAARRRPPTPLRTGPRTSWTLSWTTNPVRGGAPCRRPSPPLFKPPIQEILRRGDEVLVQAIKEGIGAKGPTLSTYISIPGRYKGAWSNAGTAGPVAGSSIQHVPDRTGAKPAGKGVRKPFMPS